MDKRGRSSQTRCMTHPLRAGFAARQTRAPELAFLALLVAACAVPLRSPEPGNTITPAMLLRGEPIVGSEDPAPLPDSDAIGLDVDMVRFIAENVDMRDAEHTRLRHLLDAVITGGHLDVAYDERTYTAAETFHLHQANCLSYTNMFVALGRAAGLKVNFQEVDIPPDWTQSGDILVLNRHVNALVSATNGKDQVVDFNMADFRASYDRRVISDTRGMAHYYSNMGVERLQAADRVTSLRYFRKAIQQDAGFAPAWINLGILYLRAGAPDFARASWWHALTLAPGDPVAMSNLERQYRQQGNVVMAEDLRRRIEHYRMQNPYYRFYLAQQAFDNSDYDTAIGHLKFAVQAKKNDDRFLALLGLSYLRRGDPEAARLWIARAAEVAGDGDGYHSKLEMLQRLNKS